MVPTEDEKVLWIPDLVCQQQADCLERLLASVYVVSKEEIVRLWRESTVLEEAKQVIVLAMDVAADLFSLA